MKFKVIIITTTIIVKVNFFIIKRVIVLLIMKVIIAIVKYTIQNRTFHCNPFIISMLTMVNFVIILTFTLKMTI